MNPSATVRAMLAIEPVFGDAPCDEALGRDLARALDALRAGGGLAALGADGGCAALSSAPTRD